MNYTGTGIQMAFTKAQWFKYLCIKKFINQPSLKPKQLWSELEATDSGFARLFVTKKLYYEVKQTATNNPNYSTNSIRDKFAPILSTSTVTARAQSIARIICPQASVCAIIDILDELSNHPAMPDIFKKYPIGQCVRSMMSMHKCLKYFHKKQDSDSMIHKHVMLSSIVYLQKNMLNHRYNRQQRNQRQNQEMKQQGDVNMDNNHGSSNNHNNNVTATDLYLFNDKLLKYLTKNDSKRENSHLIANCVDLRKKFNQHIVDNNSNNKIRLYNVTYKNRKSKIIDLWNKVDNNIKLFWDENTEPDPSPYKQVFTTLEDGSKVKHPIHYLRGSKTSFYNSWCTNQNTIALFRETGLTPCYNYFMGFKPNYVKLGSKFEYCICSKHYNFEQMWTAFCKVVKSLCKCNTEYCDNFDIENDECNCDDCQNCALRLGILDFDFGDICRHVLCPAPIDSDGCWWSRCYNCTCFRLGCGISFIDNITHTRNVCHTCHITAQTQFQFEQLETISVRKGAKVFKEAIKVEHTVAWSEFEAVLKKQFKQFLLHHIAKRIQFTARDKLYNKQGDSILMQAGDLFVSIDYIENMKARYLKMPVSMFRNPAQIALAELYETSIDRNNLVRESHAYISGDPTHDWNMSLFIIKNYIDCKKQYYLSKNIPIRNVFFWSDRSPKEFSCTSFLHGWNKICFDASVKSFWSFGSPQHGKWVHDAIGGGLKQCTADGVATGTINFNVNTPHETTIANYLRNTMNNHEQKIDDNNDIDNSNNIDVNLNNNNDNNVRNRAINNYKHKFTFHEIHNGDFEHKKGEYATLPDITKHFCFATGNNSQSVFYRTFSCWCNECLARNWEFCDNTMTHGDWNEYTFNKNEYCICKKPWGYRGRHDMVCCDTCTEWFHCYCMDVRRADVANIQWNCPTCVNNS